MFFSNKKYKSINDNKINDSKINDSKINDSKINDSKINDDELDYDDDNNNNNNNNKSYSSNYDNYDDYENDLNRNISNGKNCIEKKQRKNESFILRYASSYFELDERKLEKNNTDEMNIGNEMIIGEDVIRPLIKYLWSTLCERLLEYLNFYMEQYNIVIETSTLDIQPPTFYILGHSIQNDMIIYNVYFDFSIDTVSYFKIALLDTLLPYASLEYFKIQNKCSIRVHGKTNHPPFFENISVQTFEIPTISMKIKPFNFNISHYGSSKASTFLTNVFLNIIKETYVYPNELSYLIGTKKLSKGLNPCKSFGILIFQTITLNYPKTTLPCKYIIKFLFGDSVYYQNFHACVIPSPGFNMIHFDPFEIPIFEGTCGQPKIQIYRKYYIKQSLLFSRSFTHKQHEQMFTEKVFKSVNTYDISPNSHICIDFTWKTNEYVMKNESAIFFHAIKFKPCYRKKIKKYYISIKNTDLYKSYRFPLHKPFVEKLSFDKPPNQLILQLYTKNIFTFGYSLVASHTLRVFYAGTETNNTEYAVEFISPFFKKKIATLHLSLQTQHQTSNENIFNYTKYNVSRTLSQTS